MNNEHSFLRLCFMLFSGHNNYGEYGFTSAGHFMVLIKRDYVCICYMYGTYDYVQAISKV